MYLIRITINPIINYSTSDYESLNQIFLKKYRYGDGSVRKYFITSIV